MTHYRAQNSRPMSRPRLTKALSLLLVALLASGMMGLLSMLGPAPALAESSPTPRQDVWVPNGEVEAVAHAGG